MLLPICKNICLDELCGKGFILTPHGMKKVMAEVAPCLIKCHADAASLDPAARAAALAACPSTCALVDALNKLPPEDKKPAKTAKVPIPSGKTSPSVGAAATGIGAGWVILGVVGAVAAALWWPR